MIARFKELIKFYPKFRYKLKYIAGDLYYEEMSFEEACDKIFIKAESPEKLIKCQNDFDLYVRDNMNEKMPLDGPLVRLYFQKYDPIDQDNVPEN